QEIISLTSGNLGETVDYILETYGNQIEVSSGNINDFLGTLSATNLGAPCTACLPEITSSSSNSISFIWNEISLSSSYRIASLNLSGGQSPPQAITTSAKKDFNGLEPQLYMFAFQTFCSDGTQSSVNVIIVDISIVTQLQNGNCDCDTKDQITYNGPTDLYSTFVPWNSNCDYTKYQVCVEGTYNGNPYTSCHMVIHDNTGNSGNGLANVFVLQNCGTNATYGPGSFVGHDHYGITFGSSGMFVYLTPGASSVEFEIDKVTIKNCNCKFNTRPGEGPGKKISATGRSDYNRQSSEHRIAKVNFDAITLPNPVQDRANFVYQLDIASNTTINLYDPFGKTLKTILDDQLLEPGEYTHEIDFSAYPSGIYHMVIQIGDQYKALKIVKTK
ncbi:MAG: T9SS type A sorting domain-containing protein, partial [Bacteroidota bacterium]